MTLENELEEGELHLFDIEAYNRIKKIRATNESKKRFLEEDRKRSELARKVEQVIDKLRDPYNKRRSEIKMRIIGGDGEPESLILLTELPREVNVTTYFVEHSEASDYYPKRGRLIKQGSVPIGLYRWFWKFLESNNIWNLKYAESKEILGGAHFDIGFSRGDKKHRFSVYAPHFGKELKKYRKIVDRIDWLSKFAFFRVKDAQPFLNEISREEASIEDQYNYPSY